MTESDIITLDIDSGDVNETPSGVESIAGSKINSKVYYDMNGRQVVNPGNGIYILKTTLEDGNVKTKKVVIR